MADQRRLPRRLLSYVHFLFFCYQQYDIIIEESDVLLSFRLSSICVFASRLTDTPTDADSADHRNLVPALGVDIHLCTMIFILTVVNIYS